ncbi:MAG TPA: XRE family transcriptional regulator [Sporosarcina psychrophila]|uniref:XRE family transcriptional regulator n=1 Tax=Sporosarcina psychrophila TaxID=1476 RepID=A0A921KBQ6_SPOPS|nr:XRE family transcriptional regulator [Sporosarcina psychrophila]
MERGERLANYIEDKGYKVTSLAKESGVPYTTIRSMIERNLNNASIDNTIRICKVLGISVEDLLKEEVSGIDRISEDRAEYSLVSSTYDFYPVTVAAGLPSTIDGFTSNNVGNIKVPDSIMGKWAGQQDIYMMRINGDSMNNIFPSGSMIAVKKIEVDSLKDDDIVVFSNEHEYSVKRFYDDKENQRLIFSPDSKDRSFLDYSISYEEAKNLKIHGKVVIYIVEQD